jgi:predicted amidophosphoribosyltransferase
MSRVATKKENKMNKLRCPHCGIKLGNYLYADACPHCHEELKHNTRPMIPARRKNPQKTRSWPVRIFFKIACLVES